MDGRDKKALSAIDICDLFITPAIKNVGWDASRRVARPPLGRVSEWVGERFDDAEPSWTLIALLPLRWKKSSSRPPPQAICPARSQSPCLCAEPKS